MKRIIWSCLAVVLTGLMACKNDSEEAPVLELAETSLLFPASAGNATVDVKANRTFTAVSNQPGWCTVAISEGQVKVSVSANPAEEDRRAIVTVSLEGGGVSPAEIEVIQSLSARIRVPDEYLVMSFPGNTGGQRSVPVQTTGNKPYTATSGQAWCKVSISGFTLQVDAEPNTPGASARSAEITLSGEGMEDLVIRAEQTAFAGYVRIEDDSQLTHHVKGETNTSVYVTVSHNVPYEVASDQAWCTTERFDSEAKHHVKIAVSRNETGAVRTARITFSGGSEPVVVTLTQDAANHQTGYPRFAVLSDTHFDNREGNGETSDVKVSRALQNLTLRNGPLDAIFNAGDLTDHGYESEYDHLLAYFTNPEYVPQGVPAYYLMGNHDNYGGEYRYLAKTRQPMNQYLEIRGYPFITVSQTGSLTTDYNHAAQRFLRESHEDAAANYPGKPIFVFVHVPAQNTCYGSGGGSPIFPPLLRPYPQVILFSGHSHSPMGDARSIWQGEYTAINDGSTNYSSVSDNGNRAEGYNRVTEGLIVDLKDGGNTVEIMRLDTRRNEEILPRWAVHAPYDGSNFAGEYRGRNGLPAPVFAADGNSRVTASANGGTLTVTFPQATDDEQVHHYLIDVLDAADNSVLQSANRFSLHYLNSEMPQSLSVEFTGLPAGRQLKIRITAVDAFDNRSEEPLLKIINN
jgi:predicted MPP superfamily phosphohydrolase